MQQAAKVAAYADGVIVGSALVDMVRTDEELSGSLARLGTFLREAGAAVRAARDGAVT